jgi:type IX secretion system PorP/SprF family membrane protein
MGAQFFQNRYLANPAMAGVEQGFRANVGYRIQGGNMPGSPRTTTVTSDYRNNKVGLGLTLYKEQAGLIDQNKVVGTYAYHLPLNDDSKQIHFGLSVGVFSERLNMQMIQGSMGDQTALQFNDRPTRLDGDFGFAYTDNRFTFEGSLANLRQQMGSEGPDYAGYNTFYAAASYTFMTNGLSINPKVAYRGISDYKNLFDAGFELLALDKQLGLMGMYHSNESFTAGVNYEHKQQLRFMFLYTSGTSAVQNFTNYMFELGLQINLHKLKKKPQDQ